jgi:ParB/RepB/Spo0J family partition protein
MTETAAEMKLKQIKSYSAIYIPISSILVDEKFNVRKVYDPDEQKSLTADIKMRGQITPVMVQPRPTDSAHPYKLIVGFRRMRSLKELGVDKALVEVFDGDDFSAEAANLAENVQREDLLPYEVAQQLCKMAAKYKTSGEKLGRLVGLSGKYASNLMRLENKLCPKLLSLFHHEGGPNDKDPGVTKLLDFAALDHDAQMVEYEKYLGTASHKGKGAKAAAAAATTTTTDEDDKVKRPKVEEIDQALVNLLALIEDDKAKGEKAKYTAANCKLAIAALKWAGGAEETFPGVYSKADEEKKAAAAKVAAEEEKKKTEAARKLAKEQEAVAKKAEADKKKAEAARIKAEADAAALKTKAAEAEKKAKDLAAQTAKMSH